MKNYYLLLIGLVSVAYCPVMAQSSTSPVSDAAESAGTTPAVAEPPAAAEAHYDPLRSFRNTLLHEVKYPAPALQMGHEGTVIIRVHERGDGYIGVVRIIKSAGPLLDAAVLQAAEAILQRQPPARIAGANGRKMDFPVVFRP
ncbi:energy transducer TonB family protein [Arsenicibacter rosenii]|uniref:TonB C-terminal domain-containing protein n=1 Tax=Arsenicibacter rosenii TaxID=1750698 RepID=A0A1S2VD69_9BACT|nr:energy transducer TonB [Arsenicibacter rosenii]OIN56653.1 hypothetical protein BLX24_23785 [Arsenicibacter rosenii]